MFKKLSNSEYKYRLKVINTYHLNKEKQKIIDRQAEYSYKKLFNSPPTLMEVLFDYSLLMNSFGRLNYSIQNATIAFKKLMEVIKNVL